jgi:hypothetical protein
MCTVLARNCGLGSSCHLNDCNEWTSDRKLHGSFLAKVVQNSFRSSLVARNNRNQCCAPAWGNCIDYHCSKALELRLALGFSFATQACRSVEPLTC